MMMKKIKPITLSDGFLFYIFISFLKFKKKKVIIRGVGRVDNSEELFWMIKCKVNKNNPSTYHIASVSVHAPFLSGYRQLSVSVANISTSDRPRPGPVENPIREC